MLLPLSTGHLDSFGKLKVTIIDHNPKWDDKSREERENLRPHHRMESMRKSNILSRFLFVLVSSSRIRTYSLLYCPKVYIPHCGGPFFFNEFNVSFLYLFLFLIEHLFKCVALLYIYIIRSA